MFLLVKQTLDGEAIHGEFAVRIEPGSDRLDGDREKFGIEPGACLLLLGKQNLHLLASRVDLVVALILVVMQRREVPDAVAERTHRVHRLEGANQPLRSLPQCSLKTRKGRNRLVELCVRRVPFVPTLTNRREVPLVSRRNRVAGGKVTGLWAEGV